MKPGTNLQPMDYPPIAHGGKGRIAPYSTCHYRIPEPIKATVQRMAAAYRECIEEVREPEVLLQRVEQAINPNAPALEKSSLEDKHTIAQLQEKIAKLEEQNAISAKLLNHARREKQESLEEAQQIISQKQAAIERLMKELWDAEQAIASHIPVKERDPELEKENLELHEKIGDLDLALQNAQEEIESLNGRISYLLDERGLAQMKVNDGARIEIEKLQKLNDELEKENRELNRAYSQSEDISRKQNQRRIELIAEVEELKRQIKSGERKEMAIASATPKLEQVVPTSWVNSNIREVERLLKDALELKANAGGAIKAKIKEALPLIQIPDRD